MIIYCIENIINNKCYIGQTIRKLNRRKKDHIWFLNNNKHGNSYLQNSWNKHGKDNFRFFVLEDGFKTIDELNDAEEFWISCLYTINEESGYNLKEGGENFSYTKRAITNMRKAQIKIRGKKILQYDLEGNFIRSWDSISTASRKLSLSESSIFGNLLYGQKHGGYYQWRYHTNNFQKRIKPCINYTVLQYNLKGVFLNKFLSMFKASKNTDVEYKEIYRGLHETNKSGKYQWIKGTPNIKPKENIEPYTHHNSTKVYQYSTNNELIAVYNSIVEAENNTGIKKSNISKALGPNNTAGGFKWKTKQYRL